MALRNYTKEGEKNFILIVCVLFLILSFFVIKGILAVIIFSFILAYFLYPLHNFYLRNINNDRISAMLALFTGTTVIFLPIALLSYFLILNMIKLLVQYKIYIEQPELLNLVITDFVEKFTNSSALQSIDYAEYFSMMAIYIADFAKNFFSSIPKIIIYFLIMLFITYYILTFNKNILYAINEYIPLSLKKQNEILRNITRNLRVLFRGYFLTGLIQTIIALVGYIMFGAPNILIITCLTLFVSLIPYLGTPLIWVPVSLYMIFIGDQFNGIALLIYGTFIISMIDNFLRPVLMSDKETISPPLVFVGFVGGMFAFGIAGIILGPIIISITIILLRYVKEYYEVKSFD